MEGSSALTLTPVGLYLTHQLRVCGKTQKQVADEVGYEKPNVITMMKLGQTKVPIEKVPALSRALASTRRTSFASR